MRKLTANEKEVLKALETNLTFLEKIILIIFKKYSFKVLQIGIRYKIFNK